MDGLHPTNLGWLVLGKPAPLPCTPTGIIELLRRYEVPIAGAHVVIVGRGITVGRPLALMLTRRSENATVTVCHTGTRDLAARVREGDIVVAAAGSAGLITADMVKPGAAVLDAGVSRVDGKVAGDVAKDVAEVAGSPQPEPRRHRPDDAGDAAHERGGGGRARRSELTVLRRGLQWLRAEAPFVVVVALVIAAVPLPAPRAGALAPRLRHHRRRAAARGPAAPDAARSPASACSACAAGCATR